MTESRRTFVSAAECYVAQVARIPLDSLDGPGLGDWDLRALVGHTSRSLVTVETYLEQRADEAAVPTAAHYYLAIARAGGASATEITERGRRAGSALGTDPAGFVEELAARVYRKLEAYEGSYLLTTIVGGMRLDEYLRTRTFELVVHGLDIEAASGVEPAFPPHSLVDATTLAAEVAALSGRAPDLLRAVTGRSALPTAFNVV